MKNPFSLPKEARVVRATRQQVPLKRENETKVSQPQPSTSSSKTSITSAKKLNPNVASVSVINEPSQSVASIDTKPENGPDDLENTRNRIDKLNLPSVALDALKQDDLIAFKVSAP